MSTHLRFGILGAARIAPKALVWPSAKIPEISISRVAARDPERARTFAQEHGIPHTSTTYQALIESDDVDVVYNPLPMSLHAEWTIAALRAGKHVLCEKPFASNAAEAAAMVATAEQENRILGEAFHYRYHPLFSRVLAEIASGRIGSLTHVDAGFRVPIARPDLRWDYATSGGSLMDLGCYPVSWVRHIVGEEPEVRSAEAVEDPSRIDASLRAELVFPTGVTASVTSSMVDDRAIWLTITGTHGTIDVSNPMAPQMGNTLTITTEAGTTSGPVDAGISYEHMMRAFVDHLVHGADFPTAGTDSIANMAAIDAMYQAAGLPIRGLPS